MFLYELLLKDSLFLLPPVFEGFHVRINTELSSAFLKILFISQTTEESHILARLEKQKQA